MAMGVTVPPSAVRAEHCSNVVLPLDVCLFCEIQIAAVGLGLACEGGLQISSVLLLPFSASCTFLPLVVETRPRWGPIPALMPVVGLAFDRPLPLRRQRV